MGQCQTIFIQLHIDLQLTGSVSFVKSIIMFQLIEVSQFSKYSPNGNCFDALRKL